MFQKMKKRMQILFQYKDLLYLLVDRDIKLRYRRSVLGWVWSVLNPLLDMLVKVVVFSYFFSRSIPNYPVYLISGQLMYSFMRESSITAMRSIPDNAAMLKKIYVPKYIFTLAKINSSFVNLLYSLVALLVVMLFTHVRFTFWWFMIVIPIVELYVFCVGLGLLLAAANVFFRDIGNIWGVVTLAWMYLTPIFYDLDILSPRVKYWMPRLNPLYMYIRQVRDFILAGSWERYMLTIRGGYVAVLMLCLGLFVFAKTKDKFILYI